MVKNTDGFSAGTARGQWCNMKHTMQLKNHSGSKFAAALIEADAPPRDDLELYEAVRRTGGAYVTAYANYTFQPILPSKWTTPDQFEAIWIGDRP